MVDEAAFVWKVAYGALLPQPDSDIDVVAATIKGYEGYAFGRLTSAKTCRLSELRAIEFLPVSRRGASVFMPCAVLIGTLEEIPPADRKAALPLFPRFNQQMDPLTNVLNRPGIIALKGEEQEARQALNPDPSVRDWREFVDLRRAGRIAATCY